jgi:hypothetical protein
MEPRPTSESLDERTTIRAGARRPYVPPRLTVYGRLSELTREGNNPEAPDSFAGSGDIT